MIRLDSRLITGWLSGNWSWCRGSYYYSLIVLWPLLIIAYLSTWHWRSRLWRQMIRHGNQPSWSCYLQWHINWSIDPYWFRLNAYRPTCGLHLCIYAYIYTHACIKALLYLWSAAVICEVLFVYSCIGWFYTPYSPYPDGVRFFLVS